MGVEAQIPGPVAPIAGQAYETHRAERGRGGLQTVDTLAERDALPAYRRWPMMIVGCKEDGKYYERKADDSGWVELATGGGGGATPVKTDITTAGVQAAPARAAWNLAIVHTPAGTGAVTLPFPVAPQDQDVFEWRRAASGDCDITVSSAKQIEVENQSATSVGPMGTEYQGGSATYFASDDVWRI
jgi:hypothetical protein